MNHRLKIKENKKRELDRPCLRTNKAVEREGDNDSSCKWCLWNSFQRLGKGTETVRKQREDRDHSENSIVGFVRILKRIQVTREELLSYRLQ